MKLYTPNKTTGKRLHGDVAEARKRGLRISAKVTAAAKKAARQAAKIECKQEE